MNPLQNNPYIFWITTDKQGNIIRANRAWTEHFPLIRYAPAIIIGDHELPDFDNCDLSAPPMPLTLTIRYNSVEYASNWYLSSPDRVTVDVVGFLCTTSTIADKTRIEQLLFNIHHIIMQPICHIKGLARLLIKAPSMSDQIVPRLEQACDRVEQIIKGLK